MGYKRSIPIGTVLEERIDRNKNNGKSIANHRVNVENIANEIEF